VGRFGTLERSVRHSAFELIATTVHARRWSPWRRARRARRDAEAWSGIGLVVTREDAPKALRVAFRVPHGSDGAMGDGLRLGADGLALGLNQRGPGRLHWGIRNDDEEVVRRGRVVPASLKNVAVRRAVDPGTAAGDTPVGACGPSPKRPPSSQPKLANAASSGPAIGV
jgi:hypothetical protein